MQAGYADRHGPENARVVRGRSVPTRLLRRNVSAWPPFAHGASGSTGSAAISAPFHSPRAGVDVVAATVPVHDATGRKRAYVELQLPVSAIGGVNDGVGRLRTDADAVLGLALMLLIVAGAGPSTLPP